MILLLILGVFAGLYALSLLFSLAIYALPVGLGIEAALVLHTCHCGILASMFGGFVVGIVTLTMGRAIFAHARTPAVRAGVGMVFAVPAGVAGYHAALGLGSLVLGHGLLLGLICWLSAITVAVAAWHQIVLAQHNPLLATQPGSSSERSAALVHRRP